MAKALLTVAACAAALAGCGPAPEGARAYSEGRFADAHRDFGRAIAAEGERASADLLHDASLAALRVGALEEAEALADRAPFRDLLRGHAALLRAERAAAEAEGPRADATGWDRAIRHATEAGDLFARAAVALPGRPEARRNAERAVLRLEELAKRREAAARSAGPGGRPRVVLLPVPSEGEAGGPGEKSEEAAPPGTAAGDLPAEEVLGVLDRLAEKEREKRELRRARRAEGGGAAERDW